MPETSVQDGLIDKIPKLEPHNTWEFLAVCVVVAWALFLLSKHMKDKQVKPVENNGLYISSEQKIKRVIDTLENLDREVISLKHENRMKSDLIEIMIKKLDSLINTSSDGLEVRESIIKTNAENKKIIVALSKKFEDIKRVLLGEYEN